MKIIKNYKQNHQKIPKKYLLVINIKKKRILFLKKLKKIKLIKYSSNFTFNRFIFIDLLFSLDIN